MTTPDKRAANARDAVAVMTAWLAEPSGGRLAPGTIVQIVEGHNPNDPTDGLTRLVQGLVTLSGHLLVRRAKETGIGEAETLQDFGRRYAEQ